MTLSQLREKLAALTGQTTAKRAEINDDTAEADVARIESEHAELLRQVEDTKTAIAEAERAEAAVHVEQRAVEIDPAVIEAAAARAVEMERNRSATIADLGQRLGLVDFSDEHIRKGTSVTDFRNLLLDRLATASEEIRIMPHVEMRGQDETVTRREAMVDCIMARAHNKPVPEKAAHLRNARLIDLAAISLGLSGEKRYAMSEFEIARRALHTTSDFPNVLAAVSNKTLLGAYTARPQSFRVWARGITLPDFKAMNLIRLGENPPLAKVNEHGEYKRGTIAEGKETIQLRKYGRVVGVTYEVIVNDDLNALTRIPAQFGQSAANLESDLVYGTLMSNPTLNTDGRAVFHSAHSNYVATGGAVPSVTTMGAGRVAMSKQKGLDNTTVLNLSAGYLIIPPELEVTAAQLIASFFPATNATIVPDFIRTLTPIVEPRLSTGITNTDIGMTVAGSTTAWYMIATPGTIDTVVFANLEGETSPMLDQRIGFDVDGVEFKCRHEFGVAVVDYRGLYLNVGA